MQNKTTFIYKGSVEKLTELGFWESDYRDKHYYWNDKKRYNHFPYKIEIDKKNMIMTINTPTLATIALLMQMYKDGLIEITTRKQSGVQNLTKDELIKENEMLKQRLAELENRLIL